jgi:TetR/AcrR family transcriptional regulator, transcriptional repressor for nem operon
MATKGELTREKITRTATELFCRQGFAATSISDLIKACDITKGSLYFHFPGKDDVALAVLEQAAAEFMLFLDTALAETSPGAALDNFFQRALEFHRQKDFVGGCLFGNVALEASDCNELYAERVAQVFARWQEKVRIVIAAAQKTGQLRIDLPAETLALLVVSTIEGGIMLSRLRKEEEPLRSCLDSLRSLLASWPLK